LFTRPDNWSQLSWQERREERFSHWLAPDVRFAGPEAGERYRQRVGRFIKAIKLEEADRVPVLLPVEYYPAYYAGGNLKKVMYDANELRRAWLKFLQDFDMDSFYPPGLVLPGRVLDMIDYKLQRWPGHGLPDDAPSHQYIEGEYMPAGEYDAFLRDPADYLMRYFLPRTSGAFRGFGRMSAITPMVGIPVWYVAQFGDPEIRATFEKLLEAGRECTKWMAVVGEVGRAAQAAGFPAHWGGLCGAPYDNIGDMLRGTHGIMMDMFQRPDKLREAMEKLVPIVIDEAIGQADASGCPVIFMPLHKGTGGFMSNKQFEVFYWPTFKAVMMGLVGEGLVPMPFAEGDYGDRLEIVRDMPRSSVIWFFEQMDMPRAKKVLGGGACIAGNVPASVLCTGTPAEVKEHCRRLIEACAPGGGYILAGAVHMDKGNPDNLRAMMAAANEFGVYGK
jgi:uroporphyrinogen-III decarboxylase